MTGRRSPASSKVASSLIASISQTIGDLREIIDALHAAALEDLGNVRKSGTMTIQCLSTVERVSVRELSKPVSSVLGLGFAADPQVFKEPGLAWWRRGLGGQGVQPLGVRTIPGAIDYYDYMQTEWWRGSITNEDDQIFGPYVDHSGTNAYILTFAKRVTYREKTAGAVVLDVLIDTLQSMWQAPLLRLPKPCSVVNGEGVVIATNDSALMANIVVPSPSMNCIGVDGTDWSICQGDRN